MNRRDPQLFDVYRADLASGTLELAEENPGFAGFVADPGLRLVGALVMVRDDASDGWRPLCQVDHEDFASFGLPGVTAAGELVILSSSGARSTRLMLLDPRSGRSETVFEDEAGYDVVGTELDPASGRPRLAVVERERRELEILDPALAGDIARLRARCAGEPRLLGRDRADRRWLVLDNCDDSPASYHLYDRATGDFTFLFHHLPELAEQTLAPMEPFSFKARDGLLIHGYASFPPGLARRGLPTVVEIHGGPWTRDRWGFRAEPQWLANRGYLCVQVNFRGSTGYGKDFLSAGDREWGGAMLHDVVDAVRHLAESGACDPARVAAYGSSYGGYAALAAAAFAPGVFSCAVCFAAPTDLRSFIASVPGTWNPTIEELHRRVGDPVADADFLWARSPMSRVGEIGIPLLIGHGANDPRVRQAEAEQLVAELRARGVPHEYLAFAEEGHCLAGRAAADGRARRGHHDERPGSGRDGRHCPADGQRGGRVDQGQPRAPDPSVLRAGARCAGGPRRGDRGPGRRSAAGHRRRCGRRLGHGNVQPAAAGQAHAGDPGAGHGQGERAGPGVLRGLGVLRPAPPERARGTDATAGDD